MKRLRPRVATLFFFVLFHTVASGSGPRAGFFLPDSVSEMTLNYRTARGLIVLPVMINDSVEVNLILDTGCRNLILFGKKFTDLLAARSPRPVEFSGLGDGRPVRGVLSTGNKVSIGSVLGQEIPIVIVKNRSLFANYHKVDGVIGYEIFVKFEIEVNAAERTITFRPAAKAQVPQGFELIPLRIVDARPVMHSQVVIGKNAPRTFELMIDTGSSLGLLLKSTNISDFVTHADPEVLGLGLNGPVSGYQVIARKVILEGLELERIPTGIVSSQWHNNASIGMEVLKDYILVLNYSKLYACLKRNES